MFNSVQNKLREKCHSHKDYNPMLINNTSSFKLTENDRKSIPIINRAKHNFTY